MRTSIGDVLENEHVDEAIRLLYRRDELGGEATQPASTSPDHAANPPVEEPEAAKTAGRAASETPPPVESARVRRRHITAVSPAAVWRASIAAFGEIHTAGGRIDIPVVRARQVVDPTGCGDAYRAGLIHGLVRGHDWALTGRIASLIMSCLRHRDRVPLGALALIGVFSTHITGGVVVVTFVAAWWLCGVLWQPIRGRLSDFLTLVAVAVPTLLALLPQFLGVLQQAEIIAGHEFVTHESRSRALFDAIVQHTRHLNDFPIQNIAIALAAAGGVLLLMPRFPRRRLWVPAVWLLLVLAIVHSSAPFGGPAGTVIAKFSDLFYSDPRRLSGVITLLITPLAGLALFTAVLFVVGVVRRLLPRDPGDRFGAAAVSVLLVCSTVGLAWHYFPRHRSLLGEKYDQVMVGPRALEAFAHLATLPGARDTLIGNANTDGTAWMYAIAGLHPLWTHYDYPVQQGPGYHRFVIWAYADDADHDPRVAQAVDALGIRYLVTGSPVVRGFTMPDGLVSLEESRSWAKIYDNGQTRIYEWRGGAHTP